MRAWLDEADGEGSLRERELRGGREGMRHAEAGGERALRGGCGGDPDGGSLTPVCSLPLALEKLVPAHEVI